VKSLKKLVQLEHTAMKGKWLEVGTLNHSAMDAPKYINKHTLLKVSQ
jgi:hypothetical protein